MLRLRQRAGEGTLMPRRLRQPEGRHRRTKSMKIVANRKWVVRDRAQAERIKARLIEQGAVEEKVTGAYEQWRLCHSDAKWTYYSTGTLYVTDSDDPSLLEAQRHVDQLLGGRFVPPTRDFLLGLDETGKGEIFGPVVLAAVVLPRALFRQVEEVIGVADTKAKHAARYWEELFGRIDFYRAQGLDWATAKIEPEEFDRVSINRLLDRYYQRLLAEAFQRIDPKQARVVLDDYGAGRALNRHFARLGETGAEVVRTTKADDRYLECRLASLVAKREQQRALEAIRRDPRYAPEGGELGSGNAGDPKTLAWLRVWRRSGRPWPPFVKRSFRTVQEIDGLPPASKRRLVD